MSADARKSYEEWNAYRRASVSGPRGDLALIGLHEIRERNTAVEGVPGLWSPLAPGVLGLALTAGSEDRVEVDGRGLDGTIKLTADREVVRFTDRLTAQATWQPGSDHLLAIWDAEKAEVGSFERIEVYPFDPAWVIEAEFVPADEERRVDFSHVSDRDGHSRSHESPGDFRFVFEGRERVLKPFDSDGSLIVVFGDATNGKETYGMGRMVAAKLGEDGKATLDFNQAFLPPCAFSPHFNCPLPPAGNRLPFGIKAGERSVLHRG